MKTFKQHLIEARGSGGLEMEQVIVSAAKGEKYTIKNKSIAPDAGDKIVTQLKKDRVLKKGVNVYLIDKLYSMRKDYAAFWPEAAKKQKSKTDFIMGKNKISLKTGNSANLGEGTRGEATALFYHALERSGNDIPIGKHLDRLEKNYSKLWQSVSNPADVKGDYKELGKTIKSKLVEDARKLSKEVVKDLQDAFNKHPSFAYHFTYLNMTGEAKFGKNSPATANGFLVVDHSGNHAKYHPATDDAYIKTIAARSKPVCRLRGKPPTKKSQGYSIWGMGIGQTIDKLLKDSFETEGNLLTEATVWNKIVTYLKKVFARIIKWIGDSWIKLLSFLQVTPEVIYKNNIKF